MEEVNIRNKQCATQVLEDQLLFFKNMSKCSEFDDWTELRNLFRERILSLNALQKEYDDKMKLISMAHNELQDVEDELLKETMAVAQQQQIFDEKIVQSKLLRSYWEQYSQRLAQAKLTKPSSKDLQLLQTYKKKIEAYRKLTGVQWDHASSNELVLHGFIRDIYNEKLKPFGLDIQSKSREEIVREMWKICEAKSGGN